MPINDRIKQIWHTIDYPEHICKQTGIRYTEIIRNKLAPTVIFVSGIGLDRETLSHLFKRITSSKNVLNDFNIIGITLPGFEPTENNFDNSVKAIQIKSQATSLSKFIERQKFSNSCKKIYLYSFSFGSDVSMIALGDFLAPVDYAIISDINTSTESAFITRKMSNYYKNIPIKKMEFAKQRSMLKKYIDDSIKNEKYKNYSPAEKIKIKLYNTIYYESILNKNWKQLVSSAHEIHRSLKTMTTYENGINRQLKSSNNTKKLFAFSNLNDYNEFEKFEYINQKPSEIILNCSNRGHFYNIEPDGVFYNFELLFSHFNITIK